MVNKHLLKFEEKGDYFDEVQYNDCKCTSDSNNSWASWNPVYGSSPSSNAKPATSRRRLRVGWLGLFVFLLALVSSLYLVWKWHELNITTNRINRSQFYTRELKLVSVFSRHGDRAPSDELPDVDKHKNAIKFFWPNGLHNLTDLGKTRSYKLGLALRHMYDGYMNGYDHCQVLAFSSSKLRCLESLQNTLKGFYELEGPKSRGLNIIAQWQSDTNCTECLPNGSGSPEEWKLINLDSETVRTLSERETEQCRYRKEHPSPSDGDLKLYPWVRALPGIDRLEQVMVQRYGLDGLQGDIIGGLYSTISSELNLARTRATIEYTDHFSDWINEVVSTTNEGYFNITLYDILQQTTVFKYRDQTVGVAKWLEIGPILTSLVDSQLVALGHQQQQQQQQQQPTELSKNQLNGATEKLYQNKRIIFYSSHDSILQRIIHHLDLISFDGDSTYEQRFSNWKKRGGDELDKLLSGLSMSSYGMSIKFELWQVKSVKADGGEFPFIQASIYNQEDGRFGEIVYKPLKLGDACTRLFKRKFAQQSSDTSGSSELDRFYGDHDYPIDWRFGCPFELFRNVTADLMVEEDKFKELC